ncbi:LPS-assembly protein LptD [uncultured Pseudoteredinibacter sp.]|uniref:LPS-assembly protein LptD n=1 Tax=uncultured Pseudoteredinibacter sp. TaxID=1641701 RepID=UPI00262FCC09|nr:LPS-assembly protein LptD [uncultured Pseudoteredinibacter sp.]
MAKSRQPFSASDKRFATPVLGHKSALAVAIALISSGAAHWAAAQEDSPLWDCQAIDGNWACEAKPNPESYQRPQRSNVFLGGSKGPAGSADATSVRSYHPLDWVNQEQLSEEQRQKLSPGCCGAFVEPMREDEEAQLDPDNAPLRLSADSTEAMQETSATLEGDVKMIQGYRQLEADRAMVDRGTSTAELDGNIRLREPGVLIKGDAMDMDMDTGEAKVHNAQYVLHQQGIHGSAGQISRLQDKTLEMTEASYSQCEPEDPSWLLQGARVHIDPKTEVGTARDIVLRVKGVPVFYTPYLQFPVGDKRKSGLLFPSISSGDSGGIDLAVPYYLNLAPNYDMTLTPRYINDRGFMLETELRHLNQYFETEADIAYLAKDEGGNDRDNQRLVNEGIISEGQASPYLDEDRWLVGVEQKGRGQSWYSRIDYTQVSDRDYLRDLDTASLSLNSVSDLRQLALAGYRLDNWDVSVKAEKFQTIVNGLESPYKQLPTIRAIGNYQWGDFSAELLNEYSRFDHSDKDRNNNRIIGDRARLDYRLSWDQQWAWGYIRPMIGARALSYQLDDINLKDGINESPNAAAAMAGFDSTIYFERQGNLFGKNYKQTFEPRLFYFYSDHADQDEFYNLTLGGADIDFDTSDATVGYSQLFRTSRFVGADRIDDANQLSLGLTSRFINQRSGEEWLRISLGQIFYFEDRLVSLNGEFGDLSNSEELRQQLTAQLSSSNIAERISARRQLDRLERQIGDQSEYAFLLSGSLSQTLRYGLDLTWRQYDDRLERGNAYIRYMDDEARVFNLSYRYDRNYGQLDSNDFNNNGISNELLDNDIEQADVSFIWPVSDSWSLIGRGNYDVTNSRELETLAGFEYNSCCYRIRLVGRRWIDNFLATQGTLVDQQVQEDSGIFFEIQLKGLGGTGKRLSSILKDAIYGYQQREEMFGN